MKESERNEIIAEISKLCDQQRDAMEEATFLGWTQASYAAFHERSERSAVLLKKIARKPAA